MKKTDDNIVWGAAAIARVINRTPRQAFHLLEAHRLPARKVGGKWAADPVVLRKYLGGETVSAEEDAA